MSNAWADEIARVEELGVTPAAYRFHEALTEALEEETEDRQCEHSKKLIKSDTITAWRCTRGEENPRVDHCECCYEDEKPLKLYEPRNEWLCPRCHEWIKYWDSLTPEQQRHEQRLMAAYRAREGT